VRKRTDRGDVNPEPYRLGVEYRGRRGGPAGEDANGALVLCTWRNTDLPEMSKAEHETESGEAVPVSTAGPPRCGADTIPASSVPPVLRAARLVRHGGELVRHGRGLDSCGQIFAVAGRGPCRIPPPPDRRARQPGRDRPSWPDHAAGVRDPARAADHESCSTVVVTSAGHGHGPEGRNAGFWADLWSRAPIAYPFRGLDPSRGAFCWAGTPYFVWQGAPRWRSPSPQGRQWASCGTNSGGFPHAHPTVRISGSGACACPERAGPHVTGERPSPVAGGA